MKILNLKYLDVDSRIDYLTLNAMYKIYNDTAPDYLCNFDKVIDIHSHVTRNSVRSYCLPQVKSQGKTTFRYNGAKLWNNLPQYVKCQRTKDSFKFKCKDYLFSQMKAKQECDYMYY